MNGLGMLIHQAHSALGLVRRHAVDAELMKKAVEKADSGAASEV